jgi:hypothetical protein
MAEITNFHDPVEQRQYLPGYGFTLAVPGDPFAVPRQEDSCDSNDHQNRGDNGDDKQHTVHEPQQSETVAMDRSVDSGEQNEQLNRLANYLQDSVVEM